MTKKELWQIFMKTGKVSDYLNYKNARDIENLTDLEDEEISDEFAQDYINNYDSDFPARGEEYEDVDQNGRFSDS
ncbi:MAG: hypothetical protein ACI4W6_06525 [Acutalibacteraceae bacterium]